MAPSSVARPTLALKSQKLTNDDDTDKKNQRFNIRTKSRKTDKPSSPVSPDILIDINDKCRYSVEEEIDGRERGAKRREKVSKKLGRKPIVSEPTSKRKAQNRAAQRAFRERKEKHLRELEAKVENLEKASEETNKENSLLRTHLEKLSLELSDYREKYSLLMKANQNPTYYELPSYLSMRPPETSHVAGNSDVNFSFDCPIYKSLPRYPMEINSTQTSFNNQIIPSNIIPSQVKPSSQKIRFSDAIAKPKLFNYPASKLQKANFSNFSNLLDTSLSECSNSNLSLLKNTQIRIHDSKSEPNTVHTKSLDTNFSSSSYNDTYFSSLKQPQETSEQPFIINEPLDSTRNLNLHDFTNLSQPEQDKFCGENSAVNKTPEYTLPQTSSCHQSEIAIGEFELPSVPNNSADLQTRLFDRQIDLQLYKDYHDPHEFILSSGRVCNKTKESSILVPAFHDKVNHENSSLLNKDNQSIRRLFESEPTQKDLYNCSNILDRIKPYSWNINNSLDLEYLCRDLKKKSQMFRDRSCG
ncbi:putative bZIP transcription factor (AP-1) [Blumeria hordei DH14]|uniref:Putative bZIP transcription factor (AP-1) n=1 Tax=Blumeria graminis f. sp. hordei (strain DH14) TaxID=546991 RepID=N1J7G6_BLUG1|nr:putative bZIP transcription factor (AP-1) [Blumeria hordei DH14]